MTENELNEIVHSEGLSPLLQSYARRKDLAQVMLTKLKLIEGAGELTDFSESAGFVADVPIYRLELLSYYETKMLKIGSFYYLKL